jgi:hypothetical protein
MLSQSSGRTTVIRAFFALAILALASHAQAAPLAFDNTFGTNGKAFANVIRGPSDVHMMLMKGLAIASAQNVYVEPNLAWKVLGPYEYNH